VVRLPPPPPPVPQAPQPARRLGSPPGRAPHTPRRTEHVRHGAERSPRRKVHRPPRSQMSRTAASSRQDPAMRRSRVAPPAQRQQKGNEKRLTSCPAGLSKQCLPPGRPAITAPDVCRRGGARRVSVDQQEGRSGRPRARVTPTRASRRGVSPTSETTTGPPAGRVTRTNRAPPVIGEAKDDGCSPTSQSGNDIPSRVFFVAKEGTHQTSRHRRAPANDTRQGTNRDKRTQRRSRKRGDRESTRE